MQKHTISFVNAFRGIWIALTTQANIRIHFLIGSLVLILAVALDSTLNEILILTLTISVVTIAEMLNTAIEFVADAVTLEQNPYIAKAKDVSAGAVLLASIFAILIGAIIFIPKFI